MSQATPGKTFTKEELLENAVGYAELTGYPIVRSSHLLLALADAEGGQLDLILRQHASGLRASTIADSLREILEIEAETNGFQTSSFPPSAPPDSEWFSPELKDIFERARFDEQSRVDEAALIHAILGRPEDAIVEAFQDAGLGASSIQGLAAEAARQAGDGTPPATRAVFENGLVRMDALGPLAQAAFLALTQIPPGRPLLADDLLWAILEQDGSRTIEALHVMSVPATTIRRYLAKTVGEKLLPRSAALQDTRLGRMLRGILDNAANAAARERCSVIGESHLVRAHIQRLAESQGNIFDRMGINAIKLREYLELYPEDRRSIEEQERSQLITDMEGYLKDRVIGQEQAVQAVMPALKRMRAGMQEQGRLLGVFLLLGPSGVGKTELAKALADVAFGPKPGVREPYLIRIDCGKLTEKRDIVQLLGAPQGLVGYKEGALPNGLRDKGDRCIVLFDEAEKANPHVWQSLLTFFDEGIVTEADGVQYDATGCILVATSNLGYREAIEHFRLFDLAPESVRETQPEIEAFIWKHVTTYFSPEFRGRFGKENVLFFNHFDRSDYRRMIDLQAQALVEEMEEKGISVPIVKEIFEVLTEMALDKREEGARQIRRLVTTHIRDRVVDAIAADPNCKVVRIGLTKEMEQYTTLRLKKRSGQNRIEVNLEDLLQKRVIHQEHAIRTVVPTLKRMRAGLNEPGRLMGAFLFLGPTGVGKTELARAIADVAYGEKAGVRDPYLININCGALRDARDIVQLLGAPQGLKGYKEGALTNGLRDKGPRCLVLFDEAEKAHPDIWQSLLPFFDEGILTEADGTRYDGTGCILVATSNLGYKKVIEKYRLFDRPSGELENLRPKVESSVWTEVTEYFSPEFRGRFGRENVLFFNHFLKDNYRDILDRQAAALQREMEGHNIKVQIEPDLLDVLTTLAWAKRDEGARPVRRLVTLHLRDRIVDARTTQPTLAEIRLKTTPELLEEQAKLAASETKG